MTITATTPPRLPLSEQQMGQLMSDLHPARVSTRRIGKDTLSYVEAHDIKAMLIRIFGFGGFSSEVIDSRIIMIRETATMPQHSNADGTPKTPQVIAQATVRLTIPQLGATYTETAIGANSGWDIGDVADNAIKSAASDALKRCAIFLGTQFGLSLYNNGSRQEIVRVIMQPDQAALLEAVRGTPAIETNPVNPASVEQINHSLGANETVDA
jgi:recombination DNA repair RAD52 pathway protein